MVKHKLKKFIITFTFLLIIIPTVLVTANHIIVDDIVVYTNKTIYNQNDTFNSSRFTKMDDLSENPSNGAIIRSENDVTDDEKANKNYDVVVSTRANKTLYFNEYLNIFKIKNNSTGYVWATGQEYYDAKTITAPLARQLSSTIVIGYYAYISDSNSYASNIQYINLVKANTINEGETRAMIPEAEATVNVSDIENGKKLNIAYKTVGIELNAYIILNEKGNLEITVPNKEIKEGLQNKKDYLARIMLAPGLGANVDGTEPGYLVVPDGCGALIRYGEKAGNERAMRFYGPDYGIPSSTANYFDNEYLTMPIYGFINGIKQDGCLAIVEEGATDCDLIIGVNGAKSSKYNYLSPSFLMHTPYLLYGINSTVTDTRPSNNCKVQFQLLENEQATYVGMANAYQDYLLEKDYLTKTTDGTFRLRLDVLMSEAAKALIGTSNVVMTSLKDLKGIINDLAENDINKLLLVLMGWNKDGLSGTTPHDLKYNTKIASKRQFKNFIASQNKNGNQVYFYNDFVHAGEKGKYSSRNDISRTIQRIRNTGTWDGYVYDEYAYLYPKSTYKLAKESVKKYNKLEIDNLALNTIGYDLFTTYYKGTISRRDKSADYYDKTLKMFTDKNFKIALMEPFTYLWRYMNAYLDIPFYTNQLTLYTDTIPLLEYTLRGAVDYYASYTNFFANQQQQLLRTLDYGSMPSYIVTAEESRKLKYTDSYQLFTTVYDDWNKTIIKNYHLVEDGFNAISDARVTEREVLEIGLVKITYSNSTQITIDYRNLRYRIEGGAGEWKTLM